MYKTLLRFTGANSLSNYRLLKCVQNVRRRLSLAVIIQYKYSSVAHLRGSAGITYIHCTYRLIGL